LLNISQKDFSVHGSFNHNGAVISSQRRAATNVSVFQVPNGTRPINRSPCGQRPYRRNASTVQSFHLQ
jgi:hypothetical protein